MNLLNHIKRFNLFILSKYVHNIFSIVLSQEGNENESLISAHEIEYIEADGEYMQLNQTDIMETDDSDDHWDHAHIKQMLNLYLQNVERFRNPKIRKKNVWVDISAEVGKGPDSCDKKFRNLKQTYIRLVKKKNRDGIATVKWPYFSIFEEIFCINGLYKPEIQEKIEEPSESVAKALLTLNTQSRLTFANDIGPECSTSQGDDVQRKLNKKRYADFKKITIEMRDRQRTVEAKLDRLINIVEESNNIQRERNRLFEQFLDKLNQNS